MLIGNFPKGILIKAANSEFQIDVYLQAIHNNKKVLLFWYPKDYTKVCPTELIALQSSISEFERLNTIIIAASCDTVEVHQAWLKTPIDKGGIEGVTYPILADSRRELASQLGILDIDNEDGDNVTYRATYLIDEEGKVFHESVNDMPLGRNINEYVRLIEAYTHIQEKGEMCPANWSKGNKGIK
jgi:peroxiredoxin (alkyl hydroperoxide reductase subunit C)